jgi:cell division protein FtsW
MPVRFHSDRALFVLTLALVVFGLAMVFSASGIVAQESGRWPYSFLARQFAAAALGAAALLVLIRVDYHSYRHQALVLLVTSLVICLLLAALFLDPVRGTHRFLRWGPFSFQPSEPAKLIAILFLAWFLDARRDRVRDLARGIVPACVLIALLLALVVAGRDLGSAVVLGFVAASMLFVAGLPLRYFGMALAAAPVAFYFLIYRVPYRWERILVFFDPERDPYDKGFQIIQSLIAVGSGGPAGAGFMQSEQKLFYLPAPHTDFIFAVVSEEFGLMGATLLLAAFTVFLWRGLRASLAAPDAFGRLLALGITVMIVGQALINMSVVVKLLPTKGLPLPFISYGGTSLLFSLVAVGVLLNITQHRTLEA